MGNRQPTIFGAVGLSVEEWSRTARFTVATTQPFTAIVTVYFAAQEGNDDLWIYVKNIGDTTMKIPKCIELFVADTHVTMESGNITYANSSAVTYWDPDETLLLNATGKLDLTADQVTEVLIFTCNGVSDESTFST